MFLKKNGTYTHFGYGAPQSAQNLYTDWFSRYPIISLALDGFVSDNNHCKLFFWAQMQVQYKLMNCNKLERFQIHGALSHRITKLAGERRKISKFRPDASQGSSPSPSNPSHVLQKE
jgi:hypothetical protein